MVNPYGLVTVALIAISGCLILGQDVKVLHACHLGSDCVLGLSLSKSPYCTVWTHPDLKNKHNISNFKKTMNYY